MIGTPTALHQTIIDFFPWSHEHFGSYCIRLFCVGAYLLAAWLHSSWMRDLILPRFSRKHHSTNIHGTAPELQRDWSPKKRTQIIAVRIVFLAPTWSPYFGPKNGYSGCTRQWAWPKNGHEKRTQKQALKIPQLCAPCLKKNQPHKHQKPCPFGHQASVEKASSDGSTRRGAWQDLNKDFLAFCFPTRRRGGYYDRTFKGHTKRGQTATPKQGSQFGALGNARQQNLLKNDTPMGTGIRSVSWIWSRSACGDWEPNLLWQNDNDHACLDALPKMRHQNRKVEVDQKTI